MLANFNRKEHLRHRAVSLRQHGFLVAITTSQCSATLCWINPWIQTFWSYCCDARCWLTRFEYLSACRICSTYKQKAPQHLENRFCHCYMSMFWPLMLNQTMNIDFLVLLLWPLVLTDLIWIPSHLRNMLYQGPEGSSTPGNKFCRYGKSLFWLLIPNQTMNTDFLILLQWHAVLTD